GEEITMENTRDNVFELDCVLGSISNRKEAINNINVVLSNLRVKMDNMDIDRFQYYFREFHTNIKILSDLLNYTMDELNADYEKAERIKEQLFDEYFRNGDESNE